MHQKQCLTNPTSSHLYLATTLLNHLATPPISLSIQGIVSRAQPLLRDLLITAEILLYLEALKPTLGQNL